MKKAHTKTLRSTDTIMSELEDVLDSVMCGSCPTEVADLRVRIYKHAIQVIALTYSAQKDIHVIGEKLSHLEVK